MTSDASLPAFVLGTAQIGMAYGVANRGGAPDDASATALIAHARAVGIGTFDTARAYGESERRLGHALAGDTAARIITKLDPLSTLSPTASFNEVESAVRESLRLSRAALGRERLDTLLLHRADHLAAWDGAVWDILTGEQERGGIGTLGVSVQSPDELKAALYHADVRHLQLPFNLLDWRWHQPDLLELLSARTDVVIHARSIFLQGLLAAEEPALWPKVPGLDASGVVQALGALAETLGRESPADLCVAYARATPFLDGLVIGLDSEAQLVANAALFEKAPLDPDEAIFVERFFPNMPETLLNPALWAGLAPSDGLETGGRRDVARAL